MTHKIKHGPGGTIPDKVAEEYARNWRDAGRAQKLAVLGNIKAFVIPKEDLDEVHRLMHKYGGKACRVYFGIQGPGEVGILRFMIVPMNEKGHDILKTHPANTYTGDDTADDDGSTVYDFTRPCPSQCDCESPMNGEECPVEIHEYHPELDMHDTEHA